jgi:hypothetical protein
VTHTRRMGAPNLSVRRLGSKWSSTIPKMPSRQSQSVPKGPSDCAVPLAFLPRLGYVGRPPNPFCRIRPANSREGVSKTSSLRTTFSVGVPTDVPSVAAPSPPWSSAGSVTKLAATDLLILSRLRPRHTDAALTLNRRLGAGKPSHAGPSARYCCANAEVHYPATPWGQRTSKAGAS